MRGCHPILCSKLGKEERFRKDGTAACDSCSPGGKTKSGRDPIGTALALRRDVRSIGPVVYL